VVLDTISCMILIKHMTMKHLTPNAVIRDIGSVLSYLRSCVILILHMLYMNYYGGLCYEALTQYAYS